MIAPIVVWGVLALGLLLFLWDLSQFILWSLPMVGDLKQYALQLVHNCVAHPLLGVLGYLAPAWAIRFHDWTAELTWPGHLKHVDSCERYDVPEESD